MGICGQKNQDQNLELIIKEKRVPEINQKKMLKIIIKKFLKQIQNWFKELI